MDFSYGGFCRQTDHRVKNKEREKINKYLDIVGEIKTLHNMKVMVIPIVIGGLGLVRFGLVYGTHCSLLMPKSILNI